MVVHGGVAYVSGPDLPGRVGRLHDDGGAGADVSLEQASAGC